MRYLILLIPAITFAEINTTGNLITNPGFDDGTTGWTLSGDAQRIGDCCPGGHDLEFGPNGSIEQSFNLINNSITQPMLNNGITLNSSVEVQNGECGVAGCWGGSGPADPFTVRLQIRDENNNVLSVTTQERYDVTGINGEDYVDSVTYTGAGSNIGNIRISGGDSNNSYLGGPNIDNVSVTMTYDDTVLTTAQTAQISTAVEEIEEIEFEEYKFEEVNIEEVKIEEFKVEQFEEPEFNLVQFVEEEIATGILNIFEEPTYEEPTTIETFTAEVESFEEENINNETTSEGIEEIEEELIANSGGEPGVESNESSNPGGGETETISETNDEEGLGETESNVASNGERNGGAQEESQVQASAEDMGNDTQDEGGVSISVSDVQEKVAETIKQVDKQLAVTSLIVAKAMQSGVSVDKYGQINNNILNQPNIDGGDYFETRDYIDTRVIYAQNQNIYSDIMGNHQEQIQQAADEVIRAEEHLRRIRGY